MWGAHAESVDEPGLDQHEWQTQWEELEPELADAPAQALAEVARLVGEMLAERDYDAGCDPEIDRELEFAREGSRGRRRRTSTPATSRRGHRLPTRLPADRRPPRRLSRSHGFDTTASPTRAPKTDSVRVGDVLLPQEGAARLPVTAAHGRATLRR